MKPKMKETSFSCDSYTFYLNLFSIKHFHGLLMSSVIFVRFKKNIEKLKNWYTFLKNELIEHVCAKLVKIFRGKWIKSDGFFDF